MATLPPTTRPNELRPMVNVAVPETDRLIPWLICPGRDRWLARFVALPAR